MVMFNKKHTRRHTKEWFHILFMFSGGVHSVHPDCKLSQPTFGLSHRRSRRDKKAGRRWDRPVSYTRELCFLSFFVYPLCDTGTQRALFTPSEPLQPECGGAGCSELTNNNRSFTNTTRSVPCSTEPRRRNRKLWPLRGRYGILDTRAN